MKKRLLIMLMVIGMLISCTAAAFADDKVSILVEATIGEGTSEVTITNAEGLAFGTVIPTSGNHRFVAGTASAADPKPAYPMTVTYFAANDAWQVRCYTDNASGGAGLIGADGTALVLKLWNGNNGPTPAMPDPEIDLNWKGDGVDGPYWSYIDDMEGTPKVLCAAGITALDPNGFDNYLAIDAAQAKAQAYSATLYVDIINQ